MLGARVDYDELLANIDGLPPAIVRGLAACMELAVEVIETETVDRCPQDTTALSTSILREVEVTNTQIRGYVGTLVDYAPYVHEGTGIYAAAGNGRKDVPWVYCDEHGNFHATKGQKPNPFLQDAVDATRAQVIQCFEGVFRD